MKTLRLCLLVFILCCSILHAASLEKNFVKPPDSAKPWVYWFWLNGNITREGITADLEAMKRVGIGGVLIMEVDQGAPVGPVDFMGAQWRDLFKHVVSEAQRLGLEVNMNNDAGWNGSGGPWIKPEESMQKIVFTETDVEGPTRFEGMLPQPQSVAGFYRDITVRAFPTPGSYRIPDIQVRAAYQVGGVGPMQDSNLLPEMIVPQGKVIDISAQMDGNGKLSWDVPPGKWTVIRFGHTSTGAQNSPAPATGRGLECDKLSKEGSEANFNGMMAKLVADNVPNKSLVATHVDSWEIGSQNWTALMREEFRKRRGYDLLPYMPVMTGRVVGSIEVSDRFLWDLRRTISELVVENYAGHIRKLAHDAGIRFTIEAYGSPCDNIPYAGEADEPMGEFWDPGGAMETCKGMASAGHVYGKPIIGAEAFTAGGQERWLQHPASIKALGDRAFCEGINRFVFHRYAMQPWTDGRAPGMTMGPWGQHYERTNTWWELTPAWHEYLSRCQYMLRQGLFVADICRLQAEAPPQAFRGLNRQGYEWDECSAEAVLTRMSVKDGRIVLPDGMSYRVLALSDSRQMTPRLLRKIKDLVEAGATIVGPRPMKSPSLSDYPKCDEEVEQLADELWGDLAIGEKPLGKGWVIWGMTPEQVVANSGIHPDFSAPQRLRYIHRVVGGTDVYFVANSQPHATSAKCSFRVAGRIPELWWPDSGRIEPAAVYEVKGGITSVFLPLGPSGSVFVVFRKPIGTTSSIVGVTRDGRQIVSLADEPPAKIAVQKALYGVLDDPKRTRDVRDKVQKIVDGGETSFQVSEMAAGDDPAYGIVKTLIVEYTVEGKPASATGTDPETIDLMVPAASEPPCALHGDKLTAWEPGNYALVRPYGRKSEVTVPMLPSPIEINGPWTVTFPPKSGAPESIALDRLTTLSEHPDPGVKYFSGAMVYHTTFIALEPTKGRLRRLDLGNVQVIAQVKLNGKDLGILWKSPFSVDVTRLLKPGKNDLEVKVTNLLINRMIGDEQLPEDSDRNPDGTLKSWPQWLQDGKPSPTGRFTFTSWRLWKKDDALPKSGLVGPVTIRSAYEIGIE